MVERKLLLLLLLLMTWKISRLMLKFKRQGFKVMLYLV
jgi:hypothetical protein